MISVEATEALVTGPTLTVTPSLAVDLSWVLHAAASPQLCQRHPALLSIFEDNPELLTRAKTFWGEDTCFTELQVLAFRAGAQRGAVAQFGDGP
jgi:hypothetical protein